MQESWTNSFDNALININPKLQWFPWVGKDYTNSSKKILIVGESHYDSDDRDGDLDFKDCIRWYINDNGIDRQSDEEQKLIRNITKAIFGIKLSTEKKQMFWKSVSYHIMVQRILTNIKERPKNEDFANGWKLFFQVINILKPDFCIFCGVTAANYNGSYIEFGKQNNFIVENITSGTSVGNINVRKTFAINKQGLKTNILFIKHPSKYFSWQKWANVIDFEMQGQLRYLIT